MGAQSSKQISRKLPQNVVSNVKSSATESHSFKKASNEQIIQEARDKGILLNNLIFLEVKINSLFYSFSCRRWKRSSFIKKFIYYRTS